MIWTLVVLLFVFWLIGFVAHVGGGLIHLLLVLAIIVAAFNLLTGRRTTV
ncbi:MAG: lmo0937 family membrane protein [Candidatus Eremiobacteraeota bacterium]|nr:lmo0937 family membrane protein [Candidatus Eremiobacteraeota bacterium]MBV8642702.1 lmo0937 family membrane protein [Candidatus Eremiobacteraeota bacterium]MBV8750802.1 lmo0937 family membrane protein [Candidatus Eremiobacteraeota bacterium]